jgi:phytoene dehydrogenase-like protein
MWHFADTGVAGLTAESFDDGRTDIPVGTAEPVERVVVVGAGIAGLTVANALAHAGVECVVVEARDRIGGRLHTVNVAGSLVDLGGSWIHTPWEPDACFRTAGRRALPQREPAA